MFDLNLDKNPEITIAKRFATENTNDLGDTLNVATSNIVFLELKKFLYLCFAQILDNPHAYIRKEQDKNYFKCPFPAPVIIGQAWNHLILYTEHYYKICTEFIGGWMDKPQFETKDEEFTTYNELCSKLFQKRKLLCPFWNLWPEYQSDKHYFQDKDNHIVWLSRNQRKQSHKIL